MKTSRKFLALFLIGLFFLFSFNAHACLIPIYGGMEGTHGSDCTMPGEEPASQFCDGFKTLVVHSGHDNPLSGYAFIPLIGEATALLPAPVQSRVFNFSPDHHPIVVPNDLLLLISVFRI